MLTRLFIRLMGAAAWMVDLVDRIADRVKKARADRWRAGAERRMLSKIAARQVIHRPAPPPPAPVLDMNKVAVLLPGDTLIVSYPNRLNCYQREQIIALIREQLPLNKVAVVDGVTAVAIARGDA